MQTIYRDFPRHNFAGSMVSNELKKQIKKFLLHFLLLLSGLILQYMYYMYFIPISLHFMDKILRNVSQHCKMQLNAKFGKIYGNQFAKWKVCNHITSHFSRLSNFNQEHKVLSKITLYTKTDYFSMVKKYIPWPHSFIVID